MSQRHPLEVEVKPDVPHYILAALGDNDPLRYLLEQVSVLRQKDAIKSRVMIDIDIQTKKSNGRVRRHDADIASVMKWKLATEAAATTAQAGSDAVNKFRNQLRKRWLTVGTVLGMLIVHPLYELGGAFLKKIFHLP